MKFILLVEGKTEEMGVAGFINRWLSQQFQEGVGVQSVGFTGLSELVAETPDRVYRYLAGPNGHEIIAVVSLMDLYGPTFYPRNKTSVGDRYAYGREHMTKRVADFVKSKGGPPALSDRYRHYFAVHETEAWLIAKPSFFRREIAERLEKLKRPPEMVNFDEPPGKLLHRLYRETLKTTYTKTVHARNFFLKFKAEDVAAVCPHLQTMLDEMREMARAAGATPVLPQGTPDQE